MSHLTAGIENITRQPLTLSCNPFVPRGHNIEVNLYFKTKEDEKAFYDNPQSQEIYMKYASTEPVGEIELRQPGQNAYTPIPF
jgi:hypothetical protein